MDAMHLFPGYQKEEFQCDWCKKTCKPSVFFRKNSTWSMDHPEADLSHHHTHCSDLCRKMEGLIHYLHLMDSEEALMKDSGQEKKIPEMRISAAKFIVEEYFTS